MSEQMTIEQAIEFILEEAEIQEELNETKDFDFYHAVHKLIGEYYRLKKIKTRIDTILEESK